MTPIRQDSRPTARPCAMLAAVALCASACGNQAPPAPSATSGDPSGSRFAVSGRVLLQGETTVEAARTGTISALIDRPGRLEWFPARTVVFDGRYGFIVPIDTTRVRVFGDGYQPCAVTLTMTGDASADVVLVTDARLLGANLPAGLRNQGPTLSGVVFRTVLGERQPVAGIEVSLAAQPDPEELFFEFARTLTDADGRYVLCNVPTTGDLVLALPTGTGGRSVEAFGVTPGVLDIQLRR